MLPSSRVKTVSCEIFEAASLEDGTYQQALHQRHESCRAQSINKILKYRTEEDPTIQWDGLLICDWKGARQQIPAQTGYPMTSNPAGLDSKRM